MKEPPRILILEDDEKLRDSMVTLLEEEGYQVVGCGGGLQAVEAAQQWAFDLIVADIRMPGISGLEALAQVKDRQPDICSMVVTGYSSEADSVRAIQLGVQEYLRKPFRLDEFLTGIQRLTRQRRQESVAATRERCFCRTAIKALELWPALQTSSAPGLGRLVLRTALELGMSPEEAEEVQLITLTGLASRSGGSRDPLPLIQELPPELRRLLSLAQERWEAGACPEEVGADEVPLAARIAAPVLYFPELAASGQARKHLPERAPGAFDHGVLETLDRMVRIPFEAQVVESPGARRRRSLLSLAQMLESIGETQSALRAYQGVVQDGHACRASLEATLALTRLAEKLGDSSRRLEFARRAIQMARGVSPVAQVKTLLQCAFHVPAEEALPLVEEALGLARQLHSDSLVAVGRLALASLQSSLQEPEMDIWLRDLTHPNATDAIHLTWRWLPTFLCRRWLSHRGEPATEQLILRLYKEDPLALEQALRQADLAQHREAFLKLLVPSQAGAVDATSELLNPCQNLPPLRILSLGPLEIYRGQERIHDRLWRSQKNRFLLACLAAHQGRTVGVEQLIEEFWPEDASTGRSNLYSALSALRKAFKPQGWSGPEPEYIRKSPGGLAIQRELPYWHDFDEFSQHCQEAGVLESQGRVDEAMVSLASAVTLYRGPFLDGCYMDWAGAFRSRVERQTCEALRRLSEYVLSQQRPLEALEYAHRLLEIDSCCQEAYHLAMKANLDLKRPEEVVRLYEQCQRVLRRELAMEPSIALLETHQRALLSL